MADGLPQIDWRRDHPVALFFEDGLAADLMAEEFFGGPPVEITASLDTTVSPTFAATASLASLASLSATVSATFSATATVTEPIYASLEATVSPSFAASATVRVSASVSAVVSASIVASGSIRVPPWIVGPLPLVPGSQRRPQMADGPRFSPGPSFVPGGVGLPTLPARLAASVETGPRFSAAPSFSPSGKDAALPLRSARNA